MTEKAVAVLNGKLVYWVLSIVLALVAVIFNDVRTDIQAVQKDVRQIKIETGGLDVLDNRVLRLEKIHDKIGD